MGHKKLTEKDLRDIDVALLALQSRQEPRQIGRRSLVCDGALERARSGFKISEVVKLVEAEVEIVPPVLGMKFDGAFEQKVGIANLLFGVRHPNGGKAVGVIHIWIQCRHDIHELA